MTWRHQAITWINDIISKVQSYLPDGNFKRDISTIETVSPEGPFCDTVQVPSGADNGDMQLI